tara:strand:+ start:1617 stop:2039 length:423 start_codon:yes stop_codon:yes gene_type:complete
MNTLPSLDTKRELTEKQKTFLHNLFDNGGNAKQAAEIAGYSGNHYQVVKSLKGEILSLAQDVLANHAPKAAFKLVEVLDSDKPIPQAGNKLQAAQTILDRVGLAKTEKLDVNHKVSGGIFLIPEKETIDIEAAEVVNEDT